MPILRCRVPTVPTRLYQPENSNRGCSLRYLPGLILRLPVSVPVVPCVIYPRRQFTLILLVSYRGRILWFLTMGFGFGSKGTCYANRKFIYSLPFFCSAGDSAPLNGRGFYSRQCGHRLNHRYSLLPWAYVNLEFIFQYTVIGETYRFFPIDLYLYPCNTNMSIRTNVLGLK